MDFSDSICQDFTYNGIITGACIIFYQGGPIDHITHIPGPVAQSSAEIEYNEECIAGMALLHFRMLIHELLSKYPDTVSEASPLIITDRNSAMCMAKNVKDTKYTSNISIIVSFVRNGEK